MDERLEELKEKYMSHEYDYNLDKKDIEHLIQQAEKVKELEREIIERDIVCKCRSRLEKQTIQLNKVYREALEFYADKEIYDMEWCAAMYPVLVDNGKTARQALKGDKQ